MTWLYEPSICADLGLVTDVVRERRLDGGENLSWATFSPDRVFRYALARIWDDHGTLLVGCSLNPSKADHEITDPTLSKWLHFARRDRYGGLLLVNIASLRATDPRELKLGVERGVDVVGPHNAEVLRRAFERPILANVGMAYVQSAVVVAAWGAPKWKCIRPMIAAAKNAMCSNNRPWHCFGVSDDGHPRHPLYLKNDTPIRLWTPDEARRAAA